MGTRGAFGVVIGEKEKIGYSQFDSYPQAIPVVSRLFADVEVRVGPLVDLDLNLFQAYEGFQKTLPKRGRWAGRPTKEEDETNYQRHLEWCKENGRDPWLGERSEYKAVELVAAWPLDALPADEEFLAIERREEEDD